MVHGVGNSLVTPLSNGIFSMPNQTMSVGGEGMRIKLEPKHNCFINYFQVEKAKIFTIKNCADCYVVDIKYTSQGYGYGSSCRIETLTCKIDGQRSHYKRVPGSRRDTYWCTPSEIRSCPLRVKKQTPSQDYTFETGV